MIADLDQVSFIDASGLGALVGAARRAAAHGTSLHVVCARAQTRQLFHLTGLDRQLHLARTLTEALQALTAPGTPTCELPQPAPAREPRADPARRACGQHVMRIRIGR